MTIVYCIVLDATGKLPDGMLVGHQKLMGNMDECLDIEVFKPHFDGEVLESFRYTNLLYNLENNAAYITMWPGIECMKIAIKFALSLHKHFFLV